jgi:hypothetical protein
LKGNFRFKIHGIDLLDDSASGLSFVFSSMILLPAL